MSYCELVTFKEGKATGGPRFANAWGGAARIWDVLFEKYLKDPKIPYHSWITMKPEDRALWQLAWEQKLSMFERVVHAFTFDRFYVKRENFPRFVRDLRTFDATYPVPDMANHLVAWATWIENCNAEGVGLYATSVAQNPWLIYEKDQEAVPRSMADGYEVYEMIAKYDESLDKLSN